MVPKSSDLKTKISAYLRKLAVLVEKRNWKKKYSERVQAVGSALYEILDGLRANMNEEQRAVLGNPLVIEGGRFNYMQVKDGLPRFDYVVPDLLLYIIIGDPRTGTRDDAILHGFTEKEWEDAYSDMAVINVMIPKLARAGAPGAPKCLIFKWCDAVSYETAFKKIGEAISA